MRFQKLISALLLRSCNKKQETEDVILKLFTASYPKALTPLKGVLKRVLKILSLLPLLWVSNYSHGKVNKHAKIPKCNCLQGAGYFYHQSGAAIVVRKPG